MKPRVEERKGTQSFEERRVSMRVAVEFEATYSIAERSPQTARITDISRNGLRIVTSKKISLGTFVEVVFEAVLAASAAKKPQKQRVNLRCRVARLIREEPGVYDYGIQLFGDASTAIMLQNIVLQASLQAASARTDGVSRRWA